MAAKRILVVEDDDHVAQGLLWALKLSGFEAEGCDSAEAALGQLATSRFDLVVSDLRLPGMTGQELLARIAACHPQVRTILITGFGSAEVQAWAGEHASAYLAKPFSAGQLVQTIDRMLAAADRMPEDNPQANPDTISPQGSAP
jgi:DNA-binding NtrC family response regulator